MIRNDRRFPTPGDDMKDEECGGMKMI